MKCLAFGIQFIAENRHQHGLLLTDRDCQTLIGDHSKSSMMVLLGVLTVSLQMAEEANSWTTDFFTVWALMWGPGNGMWESLFGEDYFVSLLLLADSLSEIIFMECGSCKLFVHVILFCMSSQLVLFIWNFFRLILMSLKCFFWPPGFHCPTFSIKYAKVSSMHWRYFLCGQQWHYHCILQLNDGCVKDLGLSLELV